MNDGVDPPTASRGVELADALAAVRERIDTAARAAGRTADEITLIAVTKTYPATDAAELLRLGVGDLGENRVDDLRAKAAAVPAARWHVIGQLQTNKVGKVIGLPGLTAIHSIDRPSLVGALGSALARRDERTLPLDCFVQVDLDPDPRPGRGGARPTEVAGLAAAVADTPGLRLAGVMAVAPLGRDPGDAFAELAQIAVLLRADHPHATAVSAGMSNDFEAAVRHGATHVRVGTALLGPRASLR
jgi:pyridoxal phosphate enzyme (YggS family)